MLDSYCLVPFRYLGKVSKRRECVSVSGRNKSFSSLSSLSGLRWALQVQSVTSHSRTVVCHDLRSFILTGDVDV